MRHLRNARDTDNLTSYRFLHRYKCQEHKHSKNYTRDTGNLS
uniref:Uncharacterized protein n=1 Tax=Moniliophthora roreri TaxID=221103 RepID=A0A0W0GEP4_MONRR